MGGTRTHVFCLADIENYPKPSWQLVDAAYKAYEIRRLLVLKNEKKMESHCFSLCFLREAPTEKTTPRNTFIICL